MDKKLYMACVGMLSMIACSVSEDIPLSGTAEETNVLMADNDLSSSSVVDNSSSSVWIRPNGPVRLCRVSEMENAPAECDWFGEMWNPESGNRVHTGFDNGSNTSGIWYWELDSGDVLLPRVKWPAEASDNYDSLSLSKVIEACNGSLCGSAQFYGGDDSRYYGGEGVVPSVSVGFAMAGKNASGKFDEVDASALNGLCVSYSLSVMTSADLVLDFGDSVNALMGDAVYAVSLNRKFAAMLEREECFAWSDFEADYGRYGYFHSDFQEPSISVKEAVKHLVGVRFVKLGYYTSDSTQFKIIRIGKYANADGRNKSNEKNYPVIDESCASPVVVSSFCECDYADVFAERDGYEVAFDEIWTEINMRKNAGRSAKACMEDVLHPLMLATFGDWPGSQPCDNSLPKVLQCSDGAFRFSTDFYQVKSAYDVSVQEIASVKKQDVLRQVDSCMAEYPSHVNATNYGELWSSSDDDHVRTDEFAEDKSVFGENAGTWFLETDSIDGGLSVVQWDNEDVRDDCDGVCGSFELDKGDLSYDPFIKVGFNVAGIDSNGVALSADVSNWHGICVDYSLTTTAVIELSMGDSLDKKVGYDMPNVRLPKKSSVDTKCFEWTSFVQSGWGSVKITGEEVAKKLVSVKIWVQGKTGTKGKFNIKKIGVNREWLDNRDNP